MPEMFSQQLEAKDTPPQLRGGFGRRLALPFAVACLLWVTGAFAATYQVGPTRPYPTVGSLPALSPGDVVEIDPATYFEVKRWTNPGTAANPIIIRGVGAFRPVFDATGKTVDGRLPNPRAVFQVEAHDITLENLEFRNARNGNNGAGIRVTSADNVTVRNCRITLCDMGFMCDNNRNLLIESSEIASNGTSLFDGYSHNLYLGGNNATLRFCSIHDALNGQNFKTRGHYTELWYNYIANSQDGELGLVDASETAATNSHAVMIGNLVLSKPRLSGYNSGRFIQFGQDSGGQHDGTLFVFNNTFIAGDGRIQFLAANAAGARIVAGNNIFFGTDKILGTLGGGINGSNNWMQATAVVPPTFFATVQGNDPGFINRSAGNLRLTANAACRNRGLNALSFVDGTGVPHSGLPALEYVNPLQSRPRPADGQVDLGAYEYAVPRFTAIWLNGNECVLNFTTMAGSQYDLQRASELAPDSWLPVVTNIAGTDGIVQITNADAATKDPRRFYRIRTSF